MLVFPLELRPDDACGRLKNERSVPFGAGSPNEALTGFYCLPGDDQHRAADKVRAYHSAGHFGTETVERSGSNVGHRLCDRCFCHQLSFRKVEACPRELAALEQSVFSGCEVVLRNDISREKPGLPQDDGGARLLAGRQPHRLDEPDKPLEPKQEWEKDKTSCPKPPAPEQRAETEKKTAALLDAQPHPPLASQSSQLPVMPCSAPGRKSAGPGDDI